MSNFDQWKKNQKDFEPDPINQKRNKELVKNKKPFFLKRILFWFLPTDEKLTREAVCNVLMVFSLSALFITITLSSDNLKVMSKNTLGGIGLLSLILLIVFFISVGYKVILIHRKKKGTYWPEYKNSKKEKGKEQ